MEVYYIREIAIDSAQAYCNYLTENDKGIQEIEVTELSYLNNEDMLMKLRLSSKLFDIESVFFKSWKYNKKYTVSEVKIIEYDNDKNILLIKPTEDIKEEFKNLKERDLKVISDLKFLVERVRTWYEKNGSNIILPNTRSQYEQKVNEVKFFDDLQPTSDQKESIGNILRNPFSYVWGAPGTGKTQFVLSYVVLHYIMNGDRIAILTPTNNAIEQVLRGLIKMTDKGGVSRKDIIRLGTPSKKFAEQYPEVCEHKGIQQNLEEIDKQLNILGRVLQYENSLKEIDLLENSLSSLEPMVACEAEYNALQSSYNRIADKLKKKEIDIKYIKQGLTESENEENKAFSKIDSIGNKISKLFSSGPTKQERRLEEIKAKIIDIKKEIEFETYQLNQLKSELQASGETKNLSESKIEEIFHAIKVKIQLVNYGITNSVKEINIHNWQKKKDELRLFIDKQKENLMIDKHLKEDYTHLSGRNIQDEIEKYRATRKRIADTFTEERIKSVKVIACTLDGYIGRYCEEKLNVKHIFLDEAGYANIIKALTLFNHQVPISFLGDHMQLPPVCEINDISIRDEEEYHNMFLWTQSAIFIENLFSKGRDECLGQYFENAGLNCNVMSQTNLKTTHRFGESLAKVLDKHVYKIKFNAANKQGDTQIFYINAPKLNGLKRTSIKEATQIKEFITQLKRNDSDFIILTPYKNQVRLLGEHLPDERKELKILTVHGSQGREWNTVILSVVDTFDKWFVDSQNQMSKGLNLVNTAVSRAKKNLVIVCDIQYWKNQDNQLISDLIKNGREIRE